MVNNSLQVTAVNAPAPIANLPATVSPKGGAAAPSNFHSIYLSLPNSEGPGADPSASSRGTSAGAAPVKKGFRTNLPATDTVAPVVPAPGPTQGARALALALSSQPAQNQTGAAASGSAQSGAGQSESDTAQSNTTQSNTTQSDSTPADSTQTGPAAPTARQFSQLSSRVSNPISSAEAPAAPVSSAAAAPQPRTTTFPQHAGVGLPARALNAPATSRGPDLFETPSAPELASNFTASAAPMADTQLNSAVPPSQDGAPAASKTPPPTTPPPVDASAPANPAASIPADAPNQPHSEITLRRTRSQASAQTQASSSTPTDVQTSIPLSALPPDQASAPSSQADALPPASGPQEGTRGEDPSSLGDAISKSLPATPPENLAFSLHLNDQNTAGSPQPEKPQQASTRADAAEPKRPDSSGLSSTPLNASSEAAQADVLKPSSNAAISVPLTEAAAVVRPLAGPSAWTPPSAEALHVPAAVAVHEAQPVLPDSPKISLNGEILLHLQGADQSSAAIRVIDRAGTVNVSVHASDAELRTALRSNVGELVSQLNGQGWKTDVDKPALTTVRAQTAQDSHSDGGQRSGSQQHSSSDAERQQRDRRSNTSRWLDELQQQTSGQSGNSGGKS